MATRIPYINPIRFRIIKTYGSAAYPKHPIDSRTQRTQYFRGVIPVQDYYPDYVKDELIYIQAYSTQNLKCQLIEYDTGSVRNTAGSVVTTLATGEKVYVFSIQIFSLGLNYMQIIEEDGDEITYQSDLFNVRTNDDLELLEFRVSDSENRYGGYFYLSTGVQKWFPIAYYTGKEVYGQPEDEQSKYDDDTANETILQASPKRIRTLILTDIHGDYIDVIKQQTICDEFEYMDQFWAVSEFSIEPKEDKADMFDITFKIALQDNDNMLTL